MDSPRGRILLMRVGHEPGEKLSLPMLDPLRPLPRLHGLRDRLPVRRPVRPAHRAGPAAVGAQRARGRRPTGRYRKAIFALFTHPGRLRAMVPALAARRRLRRRPRGSAG